MVLYLFYQSKVLKCLILLLLCCWEVRLIKTIQQHSSTFITLIWCVRWTRKCGPPFWLWSGFVASRWMLRKSGSFWLWRLLHGSVLRMVTTIMISIQHNICYLPTFSLLCWWLVLCFLFQHHVWQSVWKQEMLCWVATCRKTPWGSEVFI